MGRDGTLLGRFWDEIGVLEWRFWGKNEGLGRNGTIWDGFGHVQSVPFGIVCCKLFIYNNLSKYSLAPNSWTASHGNILKIRKFEQRWTSITELEVARAKEEERIWKGDYAARLKSGGGERED